MARGYDNGKVEQGCLLDLRLTEGTGGAGAQTLDWAKPHHLVALATAVTWTPLASGAMALDFNPATPDRLICLVGACADLDFTSGDFSGAAWINSDAAGNRHVFCKSDGASGWFFYLDAASALRLATCQAGPAAQYSVSKAITLNAWQLVGFSRCGAEVEMYVGGLPATATAGAHVDPASAAALNFYVGCDDLAAGSYWDGTVWRPRVWGCALTADEHAALFDRERHLFDV